MRNRLSIGWTAFAFLLALLATPALAQEANPPTSSDYLPIAPAVWCVAIDGATDLETEADPGCDAGIAAVLYRFRFEPRLSIVAALGTWSLGPGVGWTFHRSGNGTAYGIAVGLIVPWSEAGIDIQEPGVALGATLSLARPGGGE